MANDGTWMYSKWLLHTFTWFWRLSSISKKVLPTFTSHGTMLQLMEQQELPSPRHAKAVQPLEHGMQSLARWSHHPWMGQHCSIQTCFRFIATCEIHRFFSWILAMNPFGASAVLFSTIFWGFTCLDKCLSAPILRTSLGVGGVNGGLTLLEKWWHSKFFPKLVIRGNQGCEHHPTRTGIPTHKNSG